MIALVTVAYTHLDVYKRQVSTSGTSFVCLRLAAHIRSQTATRNLPILAIVDNHERDKALRALELGVNDFIDRPLDEEELLARVKTLVRRRRYIEALRESVDQTMEKAVTDQLTGLHNRRYMESQLKALLERMQRGGPVSYTHLDVYKRQPHKNGRYNMQLIQRRAYHHQ